MLLPKLNRIRTAKTEINTFRGINQSVNTGFSKVNSKSSSIYTEFKNMKNMSCEDYPCISTREKRLYSVYNNNITSNIIFINGKSCYVKDNNILVIGNIENTLYKATGTDFKKLILMGKNICIFPDNVIFCLDYDENRSGHISGYEKRMTYEKTVKLSYFPKSGSAEENWDGYQPNIQKTNLGLDYGSQSTWVSVLSLSDDYDQLQTNNTYPYYERFNNLKYGSDVFDHKTRTFQCTSKENNEKYGNGTLYKFKEIDVPYVKLFRSMFLDDDAWQAGDWVTISGIDSNDVSDDFKTFKFTDEWAKKLEGKTFKIYELDNAGMVIKCDIPCSVEYKGNITISRSIPKMDYILENENRLWGYSNENNEIYACKLGDPSNWFAYGDGLSTDSYALSIGTEGDFTGAIKQNTSILFFKENYIHKIYGTKPSNYCLTTYNAPGVEKGSSKSLVWINGVLYYKSVLGICAYSPGGVPVVISDEAFGYNKYKNAVAGRHRNKYYVSLQNIETEKYELYVYDTEKGIWDKEDNTQFLDTFTYNENLYFIDGKTNYIGCISDNNNLLSEINTEQYTEDKIEWMCETGNLYDNDLNTKFISQIQLLMELDNGTDVTVEIRTKNNESYKNIKEIHSTMKRSINIPFIPKRSDFLQIRLSGKGKARIYQIDIKYSGGSENRGKLYNI